MDLLTVVLVLFGVVVSVVVTVVSLLGARKMVSGMLSPLLAQQAETQRLLAVGMPCAARVLQIEQTGTTVAMMGEQSYELRFRLEVTPPAAMAYRGMSAPYQAEMVSLVPMLAVPRVQPGCVISVRVDPQDPRKMAFDSAAPPAPAQAYPVAMGAYPTGSPAAPMAGYGGPALAPGAPLHGPAVRYGYPQTPPGAWGGQGASPAGHGAPAGWTRR